MLPGQNNFILVITISIVFYFHLYFLLIDHSSANQAASFDDIEHSSSTLNQDQDDGGSSSGQFHHNKDQATYVRFSPESLTFGYQYVSKLFNIEKKLILFFLN